MRDRNTRVERIEPARLIEARDDRAFDRIDFAMRALDRLRPKMNVAVYSAITTIRIETGRSLRPDGRDGWATVGIPPHASREQIAVVLAELTGALETPFAIETLLAIDATGPS